MTPPLRPIPAAADIARWRLRGRGGQQTAMNDTVQKRYDEALGRLRDLASGKMTLDLTEAGDGSGAATLDASNEFAVRASAPPARAPGALEGW